MKISYTTSLKRDLNLNKDIIYKKQNVNYNFQSYILQIN